MLLDAAVFISELLHVIEQKVHHVISIHMACSITLYHVKALTLKWDPDLH